MKCSAPLFLSLLFLLVLSIQPVLFAPVPASADDGEYYEVGTIAQGNYHGQNCCLYYPGYCSCSKKKPADATWSGFCDGLVSELHRLQPLYHELAPTFPKRELAAVDDNVSVFGQNLGDIVDVFVWTGHAFVCNPSSPPGGPYADGGATLHFIAEHNLVPAWHCRYEDHTNINHAEVELGQDDCEVGIFVTCEFLRNMGNANLAAAIRHMMHRCHLILGFATDAYFSTYANEVDFGETLAAYLMGDPGIGLPPAKIYDAWHWVAAWSQYRYVPHGTVCIRCVYWNGDCRDDYLVGNCAGWGFGGQPPAYEEHPDQFTESTYWN